MARNDSGDDSGRESGKGQPDPWRRRSGSSGGPPDLDALLGKLFDSLLRLLGLKKSVNGRDTGRPGRAVPPGSGAQALVAVLVLVGIWLAYDMTYIIDQRERGVVLRFGRHVTTLTPGLSLRLPRPIEAVLLVDVSQVRSISHSTSMLTRDENIIEVGVVVQWRIGRPEDYLFNAVEPDVTLRQVTESAVREVVGKNDLDFIYTTGRNEVANRQQELIQDTVDKYGLGILVLGVEIQSAHPPEAVKAAFDDVIKASEDRVRLINEAEAYRNDIIPKARGAAVRLREEANAYRARVISQSEGEASRFEQLLGEYQRAPEVTRQRLYLDAVENVLQSSSKVFINDDASGNSLMYLPLDRLLEQRRQNQNDGRSMPGAALRNREADAPLSAGDQPSRVRAIRELR